MCFPPGKKSESTCCHHWIIWICPSSVQYHLNSANFDKHKCSNFTFFPAWFFRFGIVSGVNHRFAKFHHFFKQKSKEDFKKGTIFFHGTFHHLHKKNGGWFSAAFLRTDCWTVSFQAHAGAAWGVKGPNLLAFLMWCSLQNTRGFHRNPKNFFRDFGWFPQIFKYSCV